MNEGKTVEPLLMTPERSSSVAPQSDVSVVTTRRGFLGRVAGVLGALALPGGLPKSDNERVITTPSHRELAVEVLNDEELTKSHIKVIQSPDVKLHLGKGIFDFPVFRDAKEGKIKEAVIVLVPSPLLIWPSSQRLSGEEKAVLEAAFIRPEDVESEEDLRAISLQEANGMMVKLINPPSPPEEFKSHKYWQRVQRFWQENPELQGKVFIFLPVGLPGRPSSMTPKPKDSYPSPTQFEEYSSTFRELQPEGFRYRRTMTAGNVLRHEVSHYDPTGRKTSEYEADTGMFDSIASAWDTYQKTGDKSGYPFVFVTKEGITITKKLNQQKPDAQLV